MLTIFDRGQTRGHRYVVMDGARRVAVFDSEADAEAFAAGESAEEVKPREPKKKK